MTEKAGVPNNDTGLPPHFATFDYIMPIPGAPAGIAGVSSLMLETTASVVRSVPATLVAFCNALLVTFAGSRIPFFTMSTYSSCKASNPVPTSLSLTLLMITEPSSPALAAMWYNGASRAFNTTFAPVLASPSRVSTILATSLDAWMYAEPPPAMIPSSTAALVAF